MTVTTEADRRAVRTEMRALGTQRSPLLTSTFTTEVASCPRIVEYYGSVLRENGNACIAVEYVAGGSLGSWLDGGCRCPEAWIAHIAYQALEVSGIPPYRHCCRSPKFITSRLRAARNDSCKNRPGAFPHVARFTRFVLPQFSCEPNGGRR